MRFLVLAFALLLVLPACGDDTDDEPPSNQQQADLCDDVDCPSGFVCNPDSGNCVECLQDGDCSGDDASCEAGLCQNKDPNADDPDNNADPSPCDDHSQCSDDERCHDDICVSPGDDITLRCDDHSDCFLGEICDDDDQECTEGSISCTTVEDCPDPMICDFGQCLPPVNNTDDECVVGDDCPADQLCNDGQCVNPGGDTSCQDDDDCLGDDVCDPLFNSCVQCFSDQHCSDDQECDGASQQCINPDDSNGDGSCSLNHHCPSDQVCSPSQGQCVDCTLDSQCQPSEICVDGSCSD